jgi:FO synthase
MQGGIHPAYTGDTYLDIMLHAVKEAAPDMHVHAFSPLEVTQGAKTLAGCENLPARSRTPVSAPCPAPPPRSSTTRCAPYLPGQDQHRAWFGVMRTAHALGLRTTSTIMFGHVERTRALGAPPAASARPAGETGGFTEFVPLPFVHMEAPVYRRGMARKGPTWRETVLMHAVARLVLHPHIHNIQTSWVKMGTAGVRACLQAGANDLGGTLMNESISRAAGLQHEGDTLVPDQSEPGGCLAGTEMRADLGAVERMIDVADGRAIAVDRLQLQVLIDAETPWHPALCQPRGHRTGR